MGLSKTYHGTSLNAEQNAASMCTIRHVLAPVNLTRHVLGEMRVNSLSIVVYLLPLSMYYLERVLKACVKHA